MLLSIIIPAYNAEPYINELLDRLAPQITPDVETIIVDDGSKKPFQTSYKWANVIRQENGGASAARNTGLDTAKGDYIAFIDADDLIADNYIQTIIDKIKAENFDYCYLSWYAFGGWNIKVKLTSLADQFPPFNLAVWNRIYKRSMIGETRFNTLKACAEDAQFIRDVHEQGKKKAYISDFLYFYRSDAKDSLTKRAAAGKVDTKRIVYNLPRVTKDMAYLIDEFKELDYDTEVILMTTYNELPELANYAMILNPPQHITGKELRGEYTPLFHLVERPIKTQVVLYVSAMHRIGGIETFIYNFCYYMHKYYDILVLCDRNKVVDQEQLKRLVPFADVLINNKKPIICDTAINCRVALPMPANVTYKKKIQIVHTLKMRRNWELFESSEQTIFVSEAAKRSYNLEGEVIYNMTINEKPQRSYLFVTASRLSWEKGGGRINQLAKKLNALGVLFTWLVFTDDQPTEQIDGLVFRKPTFDVRSFIATADMYISLSDQEAFGYSIVEALELGVPVLTTPIQVLPEIGFKEGVNGFVIPYNVNECKNLPEILASNLKGFKYSQDNSKIKNQWLEVLGNTKPTGNKPKPGYKKVLVIQNYYDELLHRSVGQNEILEVLETVANQGIEQGFYELINR